MLLGPALAGVLIPIIGAPNVLYVDAATYFVAFALVLFFVPRRKPLAQQCRARHARGVRFLFRDRLLGPVAALVVVFGFLAAGMSAGLPFYAYSEFDGNSRIAGLFYAAIGAGAVVGSLVAVLAVRRIPPLRLAGVAILGFALPIWALPFLPPWPLVLVALFVATLFTPLINGPFFAVLTSRTPEALRAKALTAVVSINTLAAPLGFLVAGQVLEHWGVATLFAMAATGITLAALTFSAVALRFRELDLAPEPVPT